jgi:hypothetical protein
MTQTYYVTDDARVDQSSPDTNYGTNTTLPCYNTGTNINYALLDLPWTSITNTQDVVKIELKLRVLSNNNDSDISVTRLLSTWDESTVTYNNAPSDSVYGLYYEDSITNNIAHTYTIDLTSFIGMLNSGLYTDYGIAIHKTDIDATPISFASSEYATTAYRPYLEITELGDIGYEYQVFSTIIDTWYTVWHPTMTSIVDNVDTNQTTYEIEVQIQAPWESSVSTYYLDVGEQQMFSDVQAGYTDYFVVENYSTSLSGEIGYYPVIAVAYYREYNKRYVKTDGSDSDTGRSWDFAFASIKKGFEETPNGGQLFIESGAYSETLTALDLPSGNTSLNIIPYDKTHTSLSTATVVIGTGTITDIGDESSAASSSGGTGYSYRIHLTDDFTIPSNIVAQLFHVALYVYNGATCRARFVAYRYSGGTYTRIAVGQWSDSFTNSSGSNMWNYFYDLLIGQKITTGDFIGVQVEYISGTILIGHETSPGDTTITYLTDTEDVTSFTTPTSTRSDEIIKCRVQYFA